MNDGACTQDRPRQRRLHAVVELLLPKSRLARNATVALSGNVAGYAVMLLASPLLTRLCTPSDLGIYTVYTVLASLAGLVGTLRYEGAIPLPSEDKTASRLVVLAVGICIPFSLLAGLLLWLSGGNLLQWLKAGELVHYWPLFAIHLASGGCYEVLAGWMIRRGTFAPLARSRFTQSIATALLQVGAAFVIGGCRGLVIGTALGCLVGLLDLLRGLGQDRGIFRQVRAAEVWSVAVDYRRFPQCSVASSLVQQLTIRLSPLVLAVLYEPQIVGWFGLAFRTLAVPVGLIGLPLSRVYMAEASRIQREGTGSLRHLFARTLRKQLLFAGPPLGLFALTAPWTFTIAFGENWREAGIYCSLICPMLLLYVTNVVLATTLEVLGRMELQLQRSLVSLACIVTGILLPKLLQLDPRWAILTLSLSSSLGYLYTLWTTWRAIPAEPRGNPPRPHAFRAETRSLVPQPVSE